MVTLGFTGTKLVFECHVIGAGRLTVRQIWTVTLWEGPVEAKSRSSTSLLADFRYSASLIDSKSSTLA